MTRLLMLFALVVGVGAIAEIAVATHPALLPNDLDRLPFMAAHHTSPLLRAWILASNLVNLGCALTFAFSIASIRRGVPTWRRVRNGARVLRTVAICGVGVCLPFLLPLPSEEDARAVGIVMLTSVLAGSVAIAAACTLIVGAARRREASRSIAVKP